MNADRYPSSPLPPRDPNVPLPVYDFITNVLLGTANGKEENGCSQSNGLFAVKRGLMQSIMSLQGELLQCQSKSPQSCAIICPDVEICRKNIEIELRREEELLSRIENSLRFCMRMLDPQQVGDMYELLREEFKRHSDWSNFINCARNAQIEYREVRRIKDDANTILHEMHKTISKLNGLIRDLEYLGVRSPEDLRLATSETRMPRRWAGTPRQHYLQLLRFIEQRDYERNNKGEGQSANLRSSLEALEISLKNSEADLGCPVMAAAVKTRQHSEKTAYIRVFAAMLHEKGIRTSAPVIRAMAIAGNILFYDPELSISADDVRKAIAHL